MGADNSGTEIRTPPCPRRPHHWNRFVDYVLWGSDGKPLAVVEADVGKSPTRGQQAALCRRIGDGEGPAPGHFTATGARVWDDASGLSPPVQGHTGPAPAHGRPPHPETFSRAHQY
jgi:type I restriction enzyme R subunit